MIKLCQKIIDFSFMALFVLVPLVLTPWNYELFEFNKMLLVYLLTGIITGAWLIETIIQRRIIFRRSFWDIPLLIFLFSQTLSFLFSIDRYTSLWGYYSRFNGGLLSTICYLFLYWAFVSHLNRNSVPRFIRLLLASAVLVAGYGLAEHLGIDAQYWVQDVRNRVFSTLGQPNWLAAWLVALIPLTWALTYRKKGGFLYYLLFLLFYTCLLFTRSRSGLLGFSVTYLCFWGMTRKFGRPFVFFTVSALIWTIIFGRDWIPLLNKIPHVTPAAPATAPASNEPLFISESGDIRKVVWQGATEIWRHYPLLGTGPETFAYSYYWFRPRQHNDLSEWDFLYNKTHNEYLNYAANTGTIGLLSHLILIASFILFAYKKKRLSFSAAFLAGFASIAVTNFFGFSVVPVNLLFFLFPALLVVLVESPKIIPSIPVYKVSPRQGIIIGIIIVFTLEYMLFIINYWRADTLFSQGEKLHQVNQDDLAFASLQQAVQIRPLEPIYHDELALVSASLATMAQEQQNATLSAQLTQLAIRETDQALKTSPYNLNFWKNRTKVYYRLAEIDPQYLQMSLASLEHAAQLAPTDAKIRYNLGLIYLALEQKKTALKYFEESLQLKPNYTEVKELLGKNKL